MLVFPCPSCGAKLQMSDDLAGKKVRCAGCQAVVTAPNVSEMIQSEDMPVKAKPSTAVQEGPAERDDAPRDRPRRRAGNDAAVATAAAATGAGIGIVGIIVAVLGALLGLACCGGLLVALLVPAVQKVREAAARTQTTNNMKEIALSFHSYADRNQGRLPSPKMQTNPQGPPAELSWRVSVLPFMMSPDAMAVANRFDKSKAWNAAGNQPLLNSMPKAYTDVWHDTANAPTDTLFQQFTGPNTLWPDNNPRRFPHDLPDGTSNTFLFAEAASAVPWTKPADMVIQPNQPLPLQPGRFLAAFADGSVRFVDRSRASDATLRLYIDPRDGMQVPPLD